MCLFKRIKKLQETTEELSHIIKDQELLRLRKSNRDLDFIRTHLNNIKLSVKEVKYFEDAQTGKYFIRVYYDIPAQDIILEDNIEYPKIFKSINMLNLISVEDMDKIQKEIDRRK